MQHFVLSHDVVLRGGTRYGSAGFSLDRGTPPPPSNNHAPCLLPLLPYPAAVSLAPPLPPPFPLKVYPSFEQFFVPLLIVCQVVIKKGKKIPDDVFWIIN